MSLSRLALKNLSRSKFRSGIIFLCAAVVAGCILAAVLIIQGASQSLAVSLDRLGADIIIVPWGTLTQREQMKAARLMSIETKYWMPRDTIDKIKAVDGVALASPQLYLANYRGNPISAGENLHLVAIEPATDFTVSPWLVPGGSMDLRAGEAIAGHLIHAKVGESVVLNGYPLSIVGKLESTGTEVDEALYISYETGVDYAQKTGLQLGSAPSSLPNRVSSILVKVAPDMDALIVFIRIIQQVENVIPLKSTDMLQTEREQLNGLLRSALAFLLLICILSTIFVGLAFSITVNERRREIGVLQALGLTRGIIIRTLFIEGLVLVILGGFTGVLFASLGIYQFHEFLIQAIGVPFQIPSTGNYIGMALVGLLLALVSLGMATFYPAMRITRLEAAVAMRE
jgi:putative ABC transport system permease protein